MEHFTHLLLLLAILVAATKAGGYAVHRLGQPAVLGQLLAGLLLGPTLVNILGWPLFSEPAMAQSIRDLANIGVILLMFIAGLETDLAQLRRVGLAAFNGAVGGVVIPFAGGLWLSQAFGFPLWESIFIGTVLTATSVSISAQTLMELGRLKEKEGMAILGAAVIDDVLGLLLLSMVVALSPRSGGGAEAAGGAADVAVLAVRVAVYFAVAIAVGRLFPRILHAMFKLDGRKGVLAFSMVSMAAFSWAAEALGGVAAITGAYLAGVMVARTEQRESVEEQIKPLSYAFLVPIFLASIGLTADARGIAGSWDFALLLTLVAVATKALGGAFGARTARFTWLESWRFGVGMVSRGEVALIVAAIGLESGVIDERIFAITVFMTLVTTMVTPVLLRWTFRLRPARHKG